MWPRALRRARRSRDDGHGDRATTGVLLRQVVPVERLFMTYLETGAMNRHYKEAEAVLTFEPGTRLFQRLDEDIPREEPADGRAGDLEAALDSDPPGEEALDRRPGELRDQVLPAADWPDGRGDPRRFRIAGAALRLVKHLQLHAREVDVSESPARIEEADAHLDDLRIRRIQGDLDVHGDVQSPHAMAFLLRDVDVPRAVDAYGLWARELRRRGRAAVPRESGPRSGDDGHLPGREVHLFDQVVAGIGDEERVGVDRGESVRRVEAGRELVREDRAEIGTREAELADVIPDDDVEGTGRAARHVESDRDAAGLLESGARERRLGEGADLSRSSRGERNLAHAVPDPLHAVALADQQARAPEGERARISDLREGRGRDAVVGLDEARRPRSGDVGDGPGYRVDLAYAMAEDLRDEDASARVHGERVRGAHDLVGRRRRRHGHGGLGRDRAAADSLPRMRRYLVRREVDFADPLPGEFVHVQGALVEAAVARVGERERDRLAEPRGRRRAGIGARASLSGRVARHEDEVGRPARNPEDPVP